MTRAIGLRRALVMLVALSLAACVAPSVRQPPASAPAPAPAPAVEQPALPAVAHPSAPEPIPLPVESLWQRLRARFVMADCAYRPQVLHWAKRYSANPDRFAASLENAMPFLLLVADQIEQHDLPGEFALLPYLESGYRPLRSHGNRPAGMWQIMPATARSVGLEITPQYDARLDALASSAAALTLIARYHTEFGDWRLADMAFNAGEYRIKHALGRRDADAMSADRLAHLKVSRTTIEHLDKLLALACIIEQPDRFEVTLPVTDPGDMLHAVDLETGMDLRVVAGLADLDIDDVKRFNAAYLATQASEPPSHFLLPANRIAGFRAAAGAPPQRLLAESR